MLEEQLSFSSGLSSALFLPCTAFCPLPSSQGGSWGLLPLLLLPWFLPVPCRLCPGPQPSRETCCSCPGAAVPLEASVCSVVGPSSGCSKCLLQQLDLLLLPVLGVSSSLPCLLFAPPPSLWCLLPMSCIPRGAAESPAVPCGVSLWGLAGSGCVWHGTAPTSSHRGHPCYQTLMFWGVLIMHSAKTKPSCKTRGHKLRM